MIKNFLKECDYEMGYCKAISDVKEFIENHSEAMKMWRMFNMKDILSLLSFLEKHYNSLKKYGSELEISFDRKDGKNTRFFLK